MNQKTFISTDGLSTITLVEGNQNCESINVGHQEKAKKVEDQNIPPAGFVISGVLISSFMCYCFFLIYQNMEKRFLSFWGK